MRFWVVWGVLLASCGSAPSGVTVSAAASVKDALTEIGARFEARTERKVTLQFGASGELEKQILGGAPVDVFVSAASEPMDHLQTASRIEPDTRANIASNRLVLITYADSGLSSGEIGALVQEERVKRIVIGELATVPAGRYAKQALTSLQLWESASPRIVHGSNVRQVLDWVGRKEAELGVVYQTDLYGREDVKKLADIPVEAAPGIVYPIAMVLGSEQPEVARAFIDFVLSEEGRGILQKYGFLPP